MEAHPLNPAFLEEIRRLLGPETPSFLKALEEPSTRALRTNPLRPGAQAHARRFAGEPVPWWPGAWRIRPDARPGADPAHMLGAYYLQEASAMIPAAVLDVQPGERVLDLCAAPGGKSTQLAARLQGQGLLVSNEPVPARARLLRENLERMGVLNAIATCAWPGQLAERWPGWFDAVLVDAPCSGEGMFRREPETREEWKPNSPEGCARRQAEILDAAAVLVKPGGRLVYSTCTFNRRENEESVERFLEAHPDFAPEEFRLEGLGASEGGMLRLWPHRAMGDGHFAAKLRRTEGEIPRSKPPRRRERAEDFTEALERLGREVCRLPDVLDRARPVLQGEALHLLPESAPPLEGIRLAKPGLALMRIGRSHIQPLPELAHASSPVDSPAMALPAKTLEIDDALLSRLMNGEKPKLSGPHRGWTLLTWQGLAVAYVKLQ